MFPLVVAYLGGIRGGSCWQT